jgi:RNA polymerase sigma factor (sigma-70 family)
MKAYRPQKEPFEHWAAVTAQNAIRDDIRGRKVRATEDLDNPITRQSSRIDVIPAPEPSPHEYAELHETIDRLANASRTLTPMQSAVLTAMALGTEQSDIAKQLRCGLGSVKTHCQERTTEIASGGAPMSEPACLRISRLSVPPI